MQVIAVISSDLQQLATLIAMIVLIVLQRTEAARQRRTDADATRQREKVSQAVQANVVQTEKVVGLVNGAHTESLKNTAAALQKVAELTGHPSDIKAAAIAEKSVQDHQAAP